MLNILLTLVLVVLILILAAFGFAVGFFVGFTRENTKQTYKKAAQGENEQNLVQKEREEKAKREWKKFLSYDGSSNTDEYNSK